MKVSALSDSTKSWDAYEEAQLRDTRDADSGTLRNRKSESWTVGSWMLGS